MSSRKASEQVRRSLPPPILETHSEWIGLPPACLPVSLTSVFASHSAADCIALSLLTQLITLIELNATQQKNRVRSPLLILNLFIFFYSSSSSHFVGIVTPRPFSPQPVFNPGSRRILLYRHEPASVPLGQALTVEHDHPPVM